MTSPPTAFDRRRMHLRICGAVQGVGFRPHVHRLASVGRLSGWVRNTSGGVEIDVEGSETALRVFLRDLREEAPPLASIRELYEDWPEPVGHVAFRFLESESGSAKTAVVLPDVATCDDCLVEIFDPANRRYRYPFTNCTNCGPRFSIVEALPYDRHRTTMKGFRMCPRCSDEYDDPADRRFHAQPNACPECGPRLALWDPSGTVLARRDDALRLTIVALEEGRIVAVKGLGGFHLFADASRGDVLRRLRERKRRSGKPFALMVPSLDVARRLTTPGPEEEALLCSPAAPIVLLRRAGGSMDQASPEVAPGNPTLGLMLPSNPLHLLLTHEFGRALVATSGNLSDEPLATDENEALERLEGIADLFLVHDRPIARPVDDSVVRRVAGRPLMLRRARGYAPHPIPWSGEDRPCLAVGAHQKNTIALAAETQVVLSQHLGDLDTTAAEANFRNTIEDLSRLYEHTPARVVSDLHPDYRSSRYAEQSALPRDRVQHHVAHVFSCLLENPVDAPVLGVSWDGTGLGTDGRIWGGEFFTVSSEGIRRYAHLREFRLPGGDRAAREPRRSALGLLWEHFEGALPDLPLPTLRGFSERELALLARGMARELNAPWTSSAGRLFDAVASLIGARQFATFEGQAAMELEFAAERFPDEPGYDLPLVPRDDDRKPLLLDWGPMIDAILADEHAVSPGRIAARFHNGLVEAVVTVALQSGMRHVALTGGCFQNAHLTERCLQRLREEGLTPLLHRDIPPNDGGLAVGQLAALRHINGNEFVRRWKAEPTEDAPTRSVASE